MPTSEPVSRGADSGRTVSANDVQAAQVHLMRHAVSVCNAHPRCACSSKRMVDPALGG